jgi:hypothetical protein
LFTRNIRILLQVITFHLAFTCPIYRKKLAKQLANDNDEIPF